MCDAPTCGATRALTFCSQAQILYTLQMLVLRTLKRAAQPDCTAPYKLIPVSSHPQHVPVIIQGPAGSPPPKRMRVAHGGSSTRTWGEAQGRPHAGLGLCTGASFILDQQRWQQQQRVLLQHTLQQTVTALKQHHTISSTSQASTFFVCMSCVLDPKLARSLVNCCCSCSELTRCRHACLQLMSEAHAFVACMALY